MKTIIGWIVAIAVIWFVVSAIGGIGKYEGEGAEYWFNAYDEENAQVEELQGQVEEYQTALQEANDNIDEANSMIENVQSSSDVYELQDAIDSLSTVDTVYDPY